MKTEILIEKVDLGQGAVRFDLVAKNLPEKFLGLAADLQFGGDWKSYRYEKTVLGGAWSDAASDGKPILMVKPVWESGKLVLGVTEKASQMTKVNDGVLLSFYFSGRGKLDFSGFSKQVLSLYQGKRVDWKEVNWVQKEKVLLLKEGVSGQPKILAALAESDLMVRASVVDGNWPEYLQERALASGEVSVVSIWWVLPVLVVGVVTLILWWRGRVNLLAKGTSKQ